MKYRNSKQREIILNYLRTHEGHHSAEEIFKGVNKDENISLATIYRNLNILEDMKLIKKIPLENGYVYDKTQNPHYHFYCTECDTLYDVDVEYSDKNIEDISSHIKGKVDNHEIIIRGVCQKCLNKKS